MMASDFEHLILEILREVREDIKTIRSEQHKTREEFSTEIGELKTKMAMIAGAAAVAASAVVQWAGHIFF